LAGNGKDALQRRIVRVYDDAPGETSPSGLADEKAGKARTICPIRDR
jgi:hypothetical protein